jgi:hypothetical protein
MKALNETKNFLVEAKDRATAETPPFWRKVQNIGLVVATTGGIIMALPFLPAAFLTAAPYMITVGTLMAGQSQLTKVPAGQETGKKSTIATIITFILNIFKK